jgi:hypothetical protein
MFVDVMCTPKKKSQNKGGSCKAWDKCYHERKYTYITRSRKWNDLAATCYEWERSYLSWRILSKVYPILSSLVPLAGDFSLFIYYLPFISSRQAWCVSSFWMRVQSPQSNEIEQSYWMRAINWTHGL